MKFVIRVALLVIIFIAGARYAERQNIYFPIKEVANTPDQVGMDYREVYFNTSDSKAIHSWFIPAEAAEFTILLSHGNAGNIGHRLDKIKILHDIGLDVFIYDYRGYGKSKGFPSEKGFYRDIHGAYDYLVKEAGIPHEKIILYGESIGGAVSLELARSMPVAGLITENTFTSIKDMVKNVFPFIPHFIFSSRFDSADKIQHVHCSKLIMHSVDDEIVPFSQGEKLYSAAAQPKFFLRLRGGHNTAFLNSMKIYKEGISYFVRSL
jgi:uncharacterized protein